MILRYFILISLTVYLTNCSCTKLREPSGEKTVNMLFGSSLNQNYQGCSFSDVNSTYNIIVKVYYYKDGLQQFYDPQYFTHMAGRPSPIEIKVPQSGYFGILVQVKMPDCQNCCASACNNTPSRRGRPTFVDEIFPADETFTTFDVIFDYKECDCCL